MSISDLIFLKLAFDYLITRDEFKKHSSHFHTHTTTAHTHH